MARPLASHLSRSCPLRPRHHRSKVGRVEKVLRSSSSLSTDRMPSIKSGESILESVESVREMHPESSVPSSGFLSSIDVKTSKSPSSSVLVLPSAGTKLGHMLSLINQEDVEFKQNPHFTEILFFSKDGESRVMHPLRARRLRGLMALAHHLDEEDRFLKVPRH